jgi:hypothetical protein
MDLITPLIELLQGLTMFFFAICHAHLLHQVTKLTQYNCAHAIFCPRQLTKWFPCLVFLFGTLGSFFRVQQIAIVLAALF